MPFGLKNAGATFVRAVRSMLRHIRDFANFYVDIGVGSHDWESHLYHIRRSLNLVREAGMILNLGMCEFGKPDDVKLVGRLVGSENHLPDLQRLQGLVKIEVPSNKKELRALLGAFSYYREYIHISQPLPCPSLI